MNNKQKKEKTMRKINKQKLQVVNTSESPVDFEEIERKKINQYARDLCKDLDEYLKEFRMSPGYFYYHILFHIKQAAIFNCNYGEYKHANDHSTDEIARNYSEMLVETFPELGLKKNKETDTVH